MPLACYSGNPAHAAPFAVNAPTGSRSDTFPSHQGKGFNVHAPVVRDKVTGENRYVTDGSIPAGSKRDFDGYPIKEGK